MAVCSACDREMTTRVGCSALTYDDFGDGVARYRVPNGEHPCHDCKAPSRLLHHPGCDSERCPRCGGQAISCGC